MRPECWCKQPGGQAPSAALVELRPVDMRDRLRVLCGARINARSSGPASLVSFEVARNARTVRRRGAAPRIPRSEGTMKRAFAVTFRTQNAAGTGRSSKTRHVTLRVECADDDVDNFARNAGDPRQPRLTLVGIGRRRGRKPTRPIRDEACHEQRLQECGRQFHELDDSAWLPYSSRRDPPQPSVLLAPRDLGGNGMATLTNPLAEELEQQAVIAQDAHAGFHLVHYKTPTGQVVWERRRGDEPRPQFVTRRVAVHWMQEILERGSPVSFVSNDGRASA